MPRDPIRRRINRVRVTDDNGDEIEYTESIEELSMADDGAAETVVTRSTPFADLASPGKSVSGFCRECLRPVSEGTKCHQCKLPICPRHSVPLSSRDGEQVFCPGCADDERWSRAVVRTASVLLGLFIRPGDRP
ncbi:MAG: hypothetical protein ED559_06130 [Phycisphaera sp.]|nr:MAG: hypothetical protein ED559_06130 [Phycisphaera sp.]